MDTFEEYKKIKEPGKRKKVYAWSTAIGLQAVDGLKTSEYLHTVAKKNIEGEITVEEARQLLDTYYEKKPSEKANRVDEADKVSSRIAELLMDDAFSFSVSQYISIHKYLFSDLYKYAGKMRDYNITKAEWVLNGNTVTYGNAANIKEMLEYDIATEREFNFKDLSIDQTINHISRFIANLWQIHAFGEGNTRTTAVFLIKYLRLLGFDVDNDYFADNAWYFRNALVRANYTNLKLGVTETTEYLNLFLRNILLDETNPLQNRTLHIGKQDIALLSNRTLNNIEKLKTEIGKNIFGRTEVMNVLNITHTPASELISKMLNTDLLEPVTGYGKGKYKFK